MAQTAKAKSASRSKRVVREEEVSHLMLDNEHDWSDADSTSDDDVQRDTISPSRQRKLLRELRA